MTFKPWTAYSALILDMTLTDASVCRIEASIDFDKAGLVNPENIHRTDSSRQRGKLDWLDSHIYAVSFALPVAARQGVVYRRIMSR